MSSKESLNKRFENYGAAPNPDAWQNISASLHKKKKKAVLWWMFAGSGIAASLLIAFLVFKGGAGTIQQNDVAVEKGLPEQSVKEIGYLNTDTQSLVVDNKLDTAIQPSQKQITKHSNIEKTNKKGTAKQTVIPNIREIPNKNTAVTQNKKAEEIAITKNEQPSQIREFQVNEAVTMILPQPTELLAINLSDRPVYKIELIDRKQGHWQWGGKVGSNYSINNIQVDNFTTSNSDLEIGTANGSEFSQAYSEFLNQLPYFIKVNRPITTSLILRYSPKPRIFVQLSPTVSMLSGKPTIVSLVGSTINTKFISIGTDVKLGYKIIKKRRWAIDIAGGFQAERLFSKAPYIEKGKGLVLGGAICEIGMNYQITEKMSLRVTPEFSRVFGNSQDKFDLRLKQQSSLGLGISLLKDL